MALPGMQDLTVTNLLLGIATLGVVFAVVWAASLDWLSLHRKHGR